MFPEHNSWPNAMTYNLYSTLTSIDTSREYLYAQLEQHALSKEQFQHTVTNGRMVALHASTPRSSHS